MSRRPSASNQAALAQLVAALRVVLVVVRFVLRSVSRFVVRVDLDVVHLSCAEGRRRSVALGAARARG